ncbi:MAG: hypothetical protein P4L55_15220 [Syntrophobacteraceae bacterium]|nr:hypothetical protein [Syntrophobacteraceae bacterium]
MARVKFPDILFCPATNGLNLISFVEELAALKVTNVRVTVNAVAPRKWARRSTPG